MPRIIQRCFLVLAFTGIILSAAQETKVSDVSDPSTQSVKTQTSAPENSFNPTETSFYPSTDKVEENKNASFTEDTAAESRTHSDITAADVAQTFSEIPVSNLSERDANDLKTVSSISESFADNAHDDYSTANGALLTLSDTSENSAKIEKEGKISNTDKNPTNKAAVKHPDNATLPEHVSIDSGQNTVPSNEELTHNSSYVDKNKSSELMTSTAPSEVQSEEAEKNDAKSATHKRSLNATNSIVNSTSLTNVNESISGTTSTTTLKHDSTTMELSEQDDEAIHSAILHVKQGPTFLSNIKHADIENEEFVDTIHDSLDTKMASPTHPTSSDNSDLEVSAGHIIESVFVMPESSSYHHDASPSPTSLDALSILNEESIQPSESFDSTAQIAYMRHVSNMSPVPLKSQDLDVDYVLSETGSPLSLVTFDPDGMTHGFNQEPDSITFLPKVVYGKPTGSLSFSEHEDLHTYKPELLSDNLSTTFVTEKVDSSSHNNMEGLYSSEREREIPSPNHELLPHDEPDREVATIPSTKLLDEAFSTSESETTEKNKTVLPINDESEEMLNDSPHFTQPSMPTAEIATKYLNKHLENNISNDITHASDLKSQSIHKSYHELDFPIEYQTQQSEIRPVTAVSPIKASETSTDLPISHEIQSELPSKVTISDHPESITSDTSSSVILPNPAPSIANQSEKIISAVSPSMLPKDFILPELLPKDYDVTKLLPKDYVPPENLSKDYVTPKILPEDYVPSEILPKDNVKSVSLSPELLPKDYVSPELLPKDYVPSELLPKDYTPSEAPLKENEKPKLLPIDNVPLDLLPKDYIPPDMLPKDYSTDQSEKGNNTDANANSTIAGVAVKTSVSVSLPLSKSSNSTTDMSSNSGKNLPNTLPDKADITLSIPANTNIPSELTTEVPKPSSTQSGGLRILKPKLKNNSGESAVVVPRTRKPFLQSQQKPSSTAGPPVSIFKQARTRINSITSSTTHRPFSRLSTIGVPHVSRIPGIVPGGEMVFSSEPVTTTIATTTETEEPFSDEPFTGKTVGPVVSTEDDVTLLKVAGMIVVDKGLRWNEQLNNRLSPQYKERETFVQTQLYRLFRTSPIAPQLWKIQIDGFSGKRNSRSVVIDFFLYLIKSHNGVTPEQLITVFHDKLINNTFSRFTVDTNKTTFEFLNEELMRTTTPPSEEEEREPVIPQWAIAVIVVGAASLIFIVLFAAVAILGRHHVRRRYSNKLNDEDSDRPSDWESKMAAAYENLAADTIYDAEDYHSDTYKKSYLVD